MTVINRFLSFASVALAASVAFASGAFYQNDFSSRTSKRPVPRDEWFVKDYVAPCALFTSYDNTKSYTTDLPYSNTDRTQDGWAKTHGNYDSNQLVNFYVRMPDAATNPFASFSNGSNRWGDQYETMAVQSLNNAFSSGRLRFSVDLKGPEKMSTKYDDGYFRFKALFQSLTSPSAEKYAPYALALGMDGGNAGSYGVLQTVGSDGKWDSPTTSGRQLVAAGKVDRAHWYRFVATLNLDESTYTCSVYDMGTTQPSLSTPTPDASDGYVTGSLYRRVADNGPICGFGLHTKYMTAYSATSKDDSTLNYATCANADNIRVWWKPTGSPTGFGDEDLVYENDFATRRYRMLQGTTSSTETASALAFPASDSFSYGATATNQVGQEAARNIVQSKGTVGCDGWKLADGETKIYVVDSLAASSGCGLLLDIMADLRDQGMDIDQLRAWAEANKLRMNHWFFSTDLSFYVKGGRISKAAGGFGGMLGICPLLEMDGAGRLIPRYKIRGKQKAIREIVRMMELFPLPTLPTM